jgi:hypothetical protein
VPWKGQGPWATAWALSPWLHNPMPCHDSKPVSCPAQVLQPTEMLCTFQIPQMLSEPWPGSSYCRMPCPMILVPLCSCLCLSPPPLLPLSESFLRDGIHCGIFSECYQDEGPTHNEIPSPAGRSHYLHWPLRGFLFCFQVGRGSVGLESQHLGGWSRRITSWGLVWAT